MSDDFLIRLRLESVFSMESNGHKMSLVTLINEEEDRQLTFICDHYVSDQFAIRDTLTPDNGTKRFLPEVLLDVIRSNRIMELKKLRVLIYG